MSLEDARKQLDAEWSKPAPKEVNRWFVSRWMVISTILSIAALWLSWGLQDASPFTAVATATIALGQAKNIYDANRDTSGRGRSPWSHNEPRGD